MKNQYMFFDEQLFEDIDLSDYRMTDIGIPNTNVHIYEFECAEADLCLTDEEKAAKLDALSKQLTTKYDNSFQKINCESSQLFCGQIYPLVVKFETKLRYVLYISRALFENGNVNKQAFLLDVEKKKKMIEEIDFGEIYDAVFTDKDFKPSLLKEYSANLTKADLLKRIQQIEEKTLWRNIVGEGYDYIEKHFLEIKDFRNDVMHNHLIDYPTYLRAKDTLEKAISELERVIRDKLIVNQSEYLNKINVVDAIGGISVALERLSTIISSMYDSEYSANMAKVLTMFGERMLDLYKTDTADSEKQCDEEADAEDEDNA